MKKFNYLLFLLIGLLFLAVTNAQEVLTVTPGLGTLNDAIEANGGDKIYELTAGAWYGLDAPIENVDYHLQIIGEEYDDMTMPATIQTGQDAAAVIFPVMFDAKGDITLENLYIMNSDITDQVGTDVLIESDSGATVIINNCIIDPVSLLGGISAIGGDNKIYFTNNISLRHGNLAANSDGHFFNVWSNSTNRGVDTLLVENNTFVSTGMNIVYGNFNAGLHNFVQINHNTFCLHKSQIDWMHFETEYYWTNNLMFAFMGNPYSFGWEPMPGGDGNMPKPALIYNDTLPGEELPSSRIQFIQYNNYSRPQKFYDLIEEGNLSADDSAFLHVNFHPFLWTTDCPDYWGANPDTAFTRSREAHMFNWGDHVSEGFPHWKFGNTYYDVDPAFEDDMIYSYSDSLYEWEAIALYVNVLKHPPLLYPPISAWANWHWDLDGIVGENNTWPIFNGVYTHAATLTGSIENLPLGDLNWFPDEKAKWAAEKDAIFAHMKSGNTGKYQLAGTGVRPIAANGTSFSRMYPNPLSTDVTIEFTLESLADVQIVVYNALGQQVKLLLNEARYAGTHRVTFSKGNLAHGQYYYTIRAGNQSETHKIMIMK